MDKQPLTGNPNVDKLYKLYNLLRDYYLIHGADKILILALYGLLDQYNFNIELAKNVARSEGVTPEGIKARFKPYDVLTDSINIILDSSDL